jgi:DNA-binding transcriptional LysR family regulator
MNQSEHASLPSRLRFSLKQLEVFVAIAQGGSARSAAQRVARSQSAASAALAELEHTLAVELFDRIGRRLVLNENGRAMLPGVLALLNHAAELEQKLSRFHRVAPDSHCKTLPAPTRSGRERTRGSVYKTLYAHLTGQNR